MIGVREVTPRVDVCRETLLGVEVRGIKEVGVSVRTRVVISISGEAWTIVDVSGEISVNFEAPVSSSYCSGNTFVLCSATSDNELTVLK